MADSERGWSIQSAIESIRVVVESARDADEHVLVKFRANLPGDMHRADFVIEGNYTAKQIADQVADTCSDLAGKAILDKSFTAFTARISVFLAAWAGFSMPGLGAQPRLLVRILTDDVPVTNAAFSAASNGALTHDRKKRLPYTVVSIYGEPAVVKAVVADLTAAYPYDPTPQLYWMYSGSSGALAYKRVSLTPPHSVADSYYPFVEGGVDKFIDDYLASDEPVLILLGPPGTGKTTFIRYLVWRHKLRACFTYDEELMKSDAFHLHYMTDDDLDLMIMEDADVFLEDRENAGNKVMSKLLNVSDGLASSIDKRFIFTANITQASRIDAALMRPGRCFAVVDFRALTQEEAALAAEDAGLYDELPPGETTLAELFSIGLKKRSKPVGRLGFL